jgi:hypothetical protein
LFYFIFLDSSVGVEDDGNNSDDDATDNDETTSAPIEVVAEMQVTCRVVQHDCHPVRLLARCHRPLLQLERSFIRYRLRAHARFDSLRTFVRSFVDRRVASVRFDISSLLRAWCTSAATSAAESANESINALDASPALLTSPSVATSTAAIVVATDTAADSSATSNNTLSATVAVWYYFFFFFCFRSMLVVDRCVTSVELNSLSRTQRRRVRFTVSINSCMIVSLFNKNKTSRPEIELRCSIVRSMGKNEMRSS